MCNHELWSADVVWHDTGNNHRRGEGREGMGEEGGPSEGRWEAMEGKGRKAWGRQVQQREGRPGTQEECQQFCHRCHTCASYQVMYHYVPAMCRLRAA